MRIARLLAAALAMQSVCDAKTGRSEETVRNSLKETLSTIAAINSLSY